MALAIYSLRLQRKPHHRILEAGKAVSAHDKGRKVRRTIAAVAGFAFALVAFAYGVLVVVNLRDRPPSEATVAIMQVSRSQPIPDSDNSYLLMLGFGGPPDSDPYELGIERRNWMTRAGLEFDPAEDPVPGNYDFRARRSDAIAELAASCSEPETTDCPTLLEEKPEVIDEWLRREDWLLRRYYTLISMSGFQEAVPFELLAPLPPYDVVSQGQQLLIADAWVRAGKRDVEGLRGRLDTDLRYWRMVLRNSDVLITKMMSTAAIIRHFKLGNLVIRRLPENLVAESVPDSWRAPLTRDERSLRRSLAGEWRFFDTMNRRIAAESASPVGNWLDPGSDSPLDRIGWIVMKPFWQPQDLSNRCASMMLKLGRVLDAPMESMPEAFVEADRIQDGTFQPFGRLYNVTGDLIMSWDSWSLSQYAARVSDLEGVRRIALLAAELRAAGIAVDNVARSLTISDIADPYAGDPFTWDDCEDAVVFVGLESNQKRATHKVIY